MKEISFEQIKEGVLNWHKLANCIELVEVLFNYSFRFEVDSQLLSQLKSEQNLKVYLGYKQQDITLEQSIEDVVNNFFMVVVPDSLDKIENYRGDNLPDGTQSFCAVYYPFIGSTEISTKEALLRIGHWNNQESRLQTINQFECAPLIFQIPATNLCSDKAMNFLYLGLVNHGRESNDFQYDLIVEKVLGSRQQERAFYDTARPVPPFKPTMDNGLYQYLGLANN